MPTRLHPAALILPLLLAGAPAASAVIGRTTPPAGLSAGRLAGLPPARRAAWQAYLDRSAAAMARDKATLAAERRPGAPVPAPPPEAKGHAGAPPLDRDPAWYAGPEARAFGDNIVSFQTPSGGWGKNQDRSGPPRVPGQMYIPFDGAAARNAPQDLGDGWSFVGTIDNDATTTELAFLARLQAALPGAAGERYRASFLQGIRYLLDAEFPGGGWPQVYPLQGGYHDALTLNDDAMLDVAALLRRTAAGDGDYAFVPAATRAAAGAAEARSLRKLLALQVAADGRRTIWAQQYDPLTDLPVAARNFEPVALATAESAQVLRFFMSMPGPSREVRASVEAGAAWFAAHGVAGIAYPRAPGPEGRRLIAQPGAAPIWARFYDPHTGRPIFGDRDRSIHDEVNDLSLERRNGYSWWGSQGDAVASAYAKWRRAVGSDASMDGRYRR